MSDHNCGQIASLLHLLLLDLAQGLLDLSLALWVKSRCCLIKNQHLRILYKSTSYGNSLLLATRELSLFSISTSYHFSGSKNKL